MKWFTCIIHIQDHVSPVQWFHTRAETPADAKRHALAWVAEPQWDSEQVDVPLIFEGRLNPTE